MMLSTVEKMMLTSIGWIFHVRNTWKWQQTGGDDDHAGDIGKLVNGDVDQKQKMVILQYQY